MRKPSGPERAALLRQPHQNAHGAMMDHAESLDTPGAEVSPDLGHNRQEMRQH